MLGIYNYTVILTYIGMLSGFAGITHILSGNIRAALICLMIAGVCDMFDGKIASTMERTRLEKHFGVQIDSLSDLVCFGVLPALLTSAVCNGIWRWVPSSLYLLCALIRLAWFNVDEEERQDRESDSRQIYLGLPVTCAALIFPVVFFLCSKHHWQLQWIAPLVTICTAAAFLTPFRVKKPSFLNKIGILLFGSIGIAVIVLAGMDV